MGDVLTSQHVNDLARWAFGPTATARHLPHEARTHRCEVHVGLSDPHLAMVVYAATWAEAFAKAGWPFPPVPNKTYIALGQSVLVTHGDAKEQVATATTNTMAARIAKALNQT